MHGSQPQRPVRVQASGTGAVLSVVPLLLGYQPAAGDTVILGLADSGRLIASLRLDADGARKISPDQVSATLANLQAAGVRSAILVGYGRDVTPAVDRIRGMLSAQLPVRDALRVEGSRYWSYQCADLDCCPPEGREFPAESEASTTLRAEAGLTAAKSRNEIAATIAAPAGDRAETARQAWNRAQGATRSYQDAKATVIAALSACQQGTLPGPDEAAQLAAALTSTPVRDYAWALSAREHAGSNTQLWKTVVRNVPAEAAAAPASLLAFTAWQAGDGALANLALDRALEASPGYSMAVLLDRAISAGIPPDRAEPPMTPAAVEASYGLASPDRGDREREAS
jgi:hypothetical protein